MTLEMLCTTLLVRRAPARHAAGTTNAAGAAERPRAPGPRAEALFESVGAAEMLTFKGFRRPTTARIAMPHVHHIEIAIISTEMEVAGAQTVYVLQVCAPAPGRILAGTVCMLAPPTCGTVRRQVTTKLDGVVRRWQLRKRYGYFEKVARACSETVTMR